jgi:hypothetical protein
MNVSLCLLAAIAFSLQGIWLRNFKVANKPPASRSHLSLQERQKRIRVASWISFGIACWAVAGAIIFAWLKKA